jgi:hypothetical protein
MKSFNFLILFIYLLTLNLYTPLFKSFITINYLKEYWIINLNSMLNENPSMYK